MKVMRSPTVLLASVLSLYGCASLRIHAPTGVADEAAWQSRQSHLQQLQDWEMQGRVGIVNGKDSGSGSLDWQQRGDTLRFDFRGPLGSGALDIEGDSHALWVRSSRGDDFVTTDPEDDFASRLHMPLPVSSMRYWIMGRPDPGSPADTDVDARGELVQLNQRGWQVVYQEYAEVEGYLLPAQLTMRRDPVRIRVVVNQWTLGPDPAANPR